MLVISAHKPLHELATHFRSVAPSFPPAPGTKTHQRHKPSAEQNHRRRQGHCRDVAQRSLNHPTARKYQSPLVRCCECRDAWDTCWILRVKRRSSPIGKSDIKPRRREPVYRGKRSRCVRNQPSIIEARKITDCKAIIGWRKGRNIRSARTDRHAQACNLIVISCDIR